MIEISGLNKSFSGHSVLKQIQVSVKAGELKAIIGPSGCGKSTLLRCLNGLERIDSGNIEIHGVRLEVRPGEMLSETEYRRGMQDIRRNVGMVFQSFNLFPHKTVLENVSLALVTVKKQSVAIAQEQAMSFLRKVSCESLAARYPHEISGGQQQRVAIARALALNPRVMLYDEPTSALDPELVDEVLDVVRNLDAEGMTQVVVTHEMHFAKNVADEIIFMDCGEIVEQAPPDRLFRDPQDDRTRKFLRRFL